MNRLIVWFLQKFPAPDRRAIYRAALGDLNHVRRRAEMLRRGHEREEDGALPDRRPEAETSCEGRRRPGDKDMPKLRQAV